MSLAADCQQYRGRSTTTFAFFQSGAAIEPYVKRKKDEKKMKKKVLTSLFVVQVEPPTIKDRQIDPPTADLLKRPSINSP